MGIIQNKTGVQNRIAGRTNTWTPKYPGSAVSPERGSYSEPQHGGAAYELAPESSHVYGWKLQSGGFIRKFYAPTVGAGDTSAIITVAFKEKRKGGYTGRIASEYEYYFADSTVAEKYLDDFRSAAHPGHVVQDLERAGVRYKQVSRR